MSITNKDFQVNRQHLIDGLTFLKENSDDYANINISLANAANYPEDGILQEVSQIDELTVHGDTLTAKKSQCLSQAAILRHCRGFLFECRTKINHPRHHVAAKYEMSCVLN